jgi:hypothetical protein
LARAGARRRGEEFGSGKDEGGAEIALALSAVTAFTGKPSRVRCRKRAMPWIGNFRSCVASRYEEHGRSLAFLISKYVEFYVHCSDMVHSEGFVFLRNRFIDKDLHNFQSYC